MHGLTRITASRLIALAALLLSSHAHGGRAEHYVLENGLRVILRPIERSKQTAIVTLIDLGGDHDPDQQSGLAHLIEHLLVTCAAGEFHSRSAEQWMSEYAKFGGATNAQTGADYTVIAAVLPSSMVEGELAELGARLSRLRVTQADLDRELPRIELELNNMYRDLPQLAVVNHARQLARALPDARRPGGTIEQLRDIRPIDVQRRLESHYGPSRMTVVIAGSFDEFHIRELIEGQLGTIEPREELVIGVERAEQLESRMKKVEVPENALGRHTDMVAVGIAAPDPQHDDYPAFLSIMAQLQMQMSAPGGVRGVERPQGLFFAPIDEPRVAVLWKRLDAGETSEAGEETLLGLLESAVGHCRQSPRMAGHRAAQAYGMLLGLDLIPERLLAFNPYGVGFALGRRAQLGYSSGMLAAGLKNLDRDSIDACREAFLDPELAAQVELVFKAP